MLNCIYYSGTIHSKKNEALIISYHGASEVANSAGFWGVLICHAVTLK